MVDFIGWLKKRYLADARARNQTIFREFLNRVDNIEKPKLIDIGSGLGSNFRYLFDRIPGDQVWHFIDIDLELLNNSIDYLKETVDESITNSKHFTLDDKDFIIYLHQIDILDRGFDHLDANIIVANAFFDLLSPEQFKIFIDKLHVNLLYFTINYNGMKFAEETEEDRKYIDMYNEHMRREQAFGRAMGPNCANQMNEILNQNQFDSVVGPSDWKIKPKQTELLNFLVQYMEEAIPEHISSDTECKAFYSWIDSVKSRITNEDLEIIVQHDDIVAIRKTENQ